MFAILSNIFSRRTARIRGQVRKVNRGVSSENRLFKCRGLFSGASLLKTSVRGMEVPCSGEGWSQSIFGDQPGLPREGEGHGSATRTESIFAASPRWFPCSRSLRTDCLTKILNESLKWNEWKWISYRILMYHLHWKKISNLRHSGVCGLCVCGLEASLLNIEPAGFGCWSYEGCSSLNM